MIKKSVEFLRKLYDLYGAGLTRAEMERLWKQDTRGMYEFYARHITRPDQEQSRVKRVLLFSKELFISFLLKLTPGRRLLYAVGLFLFFTGLWQRDWGNAFWAFLILNFLLALELADKLIAKDELAVARDIQLSLLPKEKISLPGFELAAFSDAARSVGGDYYDFISLADGSTLVAIGDISGKGLSAALYMAKVQAMLQFLALQFSDPRDLLVQLNSHIHGTFKKNYFFTASLVRLYPDGRMELCRAGHQPALLYVAATKTGEWLRPRGLGIGLENGDGYARQLEQQRRLLQSGDLLVLFTDGVAEMVNAAKEEYGDGRIAQAVVRNAAASTEGLKSILLRELAAFRDGAELRDDLTLVILKRTQLAAANAGVAQ